MGADIETRMTPGAAAASRGSRVSPAQKLERIHINGRMALITYSSEGKEESQLLVSGLPSDVKKEELKELFNKFGSAQEAECKLLNTHLLRQEGQPIQVQLKPKAGTRSRGGCG